MYGKTTIRSGRVSRPRWSAVLCVALLAMLMSLAITGRVASAESQGFTSEFRLGDCTFQTTGANPYFMLDPGYRLALEGYDKKEFVEVWVTVLDETQVIDYYGRLINTRVVEEREWVDGELGEVSRNFFAQCEETGDVFYFGEEVEVYEYDDEGNLVGVTNPGEWLAGVDGAMPGIIMPGTYLLGARYFQEMAPDVAMDRGEHTAMGLMVTTPAGTFSDCVEVEDSTPLEPSARDIKVYCPGVGIVVDEAIVLTDFGYVTP